MEGLLLAEAVRALERDGAEPIHAPDVERAALHREDEDFEQRILIRAAAVPGSDDLRRSLHQINLVTGWVITAGALFALLAGGGTAYAALGRSHDGVVNFYWALGGMLGVQTLALLLWLLLMMVTLSRRSAPPEGIVSLGRAAVTIGQWLASKVRKGRAARSALQAWAQVHAQGRLGRWNVSAITHGLWLAFNVGCLAFIIVLLSTRHYTFVWETTILSERQYIRLTRALATVPESLGFAAPDDVQIARSRWTGRAADADQEAGREWSSLLIGSMVLYGFGPRILLFGFSLSRRRAARMEYRLDTQRPGFARLRDLLMPSAQRIPAEESIEPSTANAFSIAPSAEQIERVRPLGPPAIVGVEIRRPAEWPPRTRSVTWDDLGVVESRDDRRTVLDTLVNSESEPLSLIVVCDLTSTPDRGIGRFLAEMIESLSQEPAVVLTAGQALRDRAVDADAVAQRVEDWRLLCAEAGVKPERIVEQDLDHLTHAGLSRIASLVNEAAAIDQATPRRIEAAFGLIESTAGAWLRRTRPADAPAQAELHRDIAKLHRDGSGLRDLITFQGATAALDGTNPQRLAEQLRHSSQRFISFLPERLKKSPKWLAAGALSGALGCVAASLLISPAAIAAMPAWSGIGAIVAAVWQPKPKSEEETSTSPQIDDAVRAAVLFAIVLELQGRGEAKIARVIDRAIANDDAIENEETLRVWLDQVRHRFNIAVAEALR